MPSEEERAPQLTTQLILFYCFVYQTLIQIGDSEVAVLPCTRCIAWVYLLLPLLGAHTQKEGVLLIRVYHH